ncbi:Rieske 2Fe-2S domain-containing protein [Telmatospirillum sp.]|uniref:Rieske 2Fe-2S domain-containing protein n=1 Tax=Telmatospirillum sp. TaxID=2079197 RepID=UPI002842E24C|nr:Rieske 2Fe-2S domain-containing protein [Telmatospirillum sp.]MDR3439239.1 Rieske 2Fe-2S domain-containing protein [Telmatospirillum sp.]
MSEELPIEHIQDHDIRGETRWTGYVKLSNGYRVGVLVLAVGDGLIAVRNRCPHRAVPLLQGRLDQTAGTLECPSHGWELPLVGSDLKGAPVVKRDGQWFLVRTAV